VLNTIELLALILVLILSGIGQLTPTLGSPTVTTAVSTALTVFVPIWLVEGWGTGGTTVFTVILTLGLLGVIANLTPGTSPTTLSLGASIIFIGWIISRLAGNLLALVPEFVVIAVLMWLAMVMGSWTPITGGIPSEIAAAIVGLFSSLTTPLSASPSAPCGQSSGCYFLFLI